MKKFQKKAEDFICEFCGHQVQGTGYTNHCPRCFYSKHMDINPGDRAANCGGLMPTVGIDFKNNEYILIQKCEKCGETKRIRRQDGDSFDTLVKIQKEINERITKL